MSRKNGRRGGRKGRCAACGCVLVRVRGWGYLCHCCDRDKALAPLGLLGLVGFYHR